MGFFSGTCYYIAYSLKFFANVYFIILCGTLICLLQYLAFPCGLIGGALSHMGINSIVTANVNIMPVCKYV